MSQETNKDIEIQSRSVELGLNKVQTNTGPVNRVSKSFLLDPELDEYAIQFSKMINDLLGNAETPEFTRSLIFALQKYTKEMAPGISIKGIVGAAKQMDFCKLLRDTINKSPSSEFNKNWIVIVSFFWRYRNGAFAHRYINRFAESWNSDDLNLRCYQNLVNLIMATTNPETRSLVNKRVNLIKTLEFGITESGKQNIMTFYNA